MQIVKIDLTKKEHFLLNLSFSLYLSTDNDDFGEEEYWKVNKLLF